MFLDDVDSHQRREAEESLTVFHFRNVCSLAVLHALKMIV